MESAFTRKEFCKHLGMTSLATTAYPILNALPAFAGDGKGSGAQSVPGGRTSDQVAPSGHQGLLVSVKDLGARGDGVTDDTENIQRAMQSNSLIFFPAGNYKVSKEIRLEGLNNVHICATGATLTNDTLTNHLLVMSKCEFVSVTGGKYTRSGTPSESWPSDRHCLYFANCKDVIVQDVLIDGSPGMGICIANCITAKVVNNTIRNTTRDGIYSQYSLNVLYSGNYLENVGDDALSMHDYGFNAGKPTILALGYAQAGNSIITNNRVKNSFSGISSIGLQSLSVTNNIIEGVLGWGIKICNTAETYVGPDACAQDILISGNLVSYACQRNITILGKSHGNHNQGGAGKAAITVGSFGADAQYEAGNKRLANISVTGNMVNYSAADAYFLNNIDGLIFSNNSARNCNTSPFPPYTGYIVECWSCTDLCGFGNSVTDSHSPPNAIAGYRVRNSTGVIGGWVGSKYVVDAGSTSAPKVQY